MKTILLVVFLLVVGSIGSIGLAAIIVSLTKNKILVGPILIDKVGKVHLGFCLEDRK